MVVSSKNTVPASITLAPLYAPC